MKAKRLAYLIALNIICGSAVSDASEKTNGQEAPSARAAAALTLHDVINRLKLPGAFTQIEELRKMDPAHYEKFIAFALNFITAERTRSHKAFMIRALANIHPDRWTDELVSTHSEIIREGGLSDKLLNMLQYVAKIDPSDYEAYKTTCLNLLRASSRTDNSRCVILRIVQNLPKPLWPFMDNFIRQNPNFLRYVPVYSLETFVGTDQTIITEDYLREQLNLLHRQYHHEAPAGTPAGLAFEIHNYANQHVETPTGSVKTFNDAVLERVTELLGDRPLLSADETVRLMHEVLHILQQENHHSDVLTPEILHWAIHCIGGVETDVHALKTVVTYLMSKRDDSFKIWLHTFMDESKNAYKGRNSDSCIMGVKERVVTSLRNINDPALQDLLEQGEIKHLLKTKMASLGNMAMWAKRLFEAGIRSDTDPEIAKKTYIDSMVNYFESVRSESTVKAINDAID
ncbi:MAG: hypothetical protein Q8K36_03125, partial [Alphaproteobacteria bacterium]|nr:hypothetical protein [Alphaproteobacteria bacterium]